MRAFLSLKCALLIAAVALFSGFSSTADAAKMARMTRLPPGACGFEKKKVVANGTICSYNCNPQSLWCSQQLCQNGRFEQIINCFGAFCSGRCGG